MDTYHYIPEESEEKYEEEEAQGQTADWHQNLQLMSGHPEPELQSFQDSQAYSEPQYYQEQEEEGYYGEENYGEDEEYFDIESLDPEWEVNLWLGYGKDNSASS